MVKCLKFISKEIGLERINDLFNCIVSNNFFELMIFKI